MAVDFRLPLSDDEPSQVVDDLVRRITHVDPTI